MKRIAPLVVAVLVLSACSGSASSTTTTTSVGAAVTSTSTTVDVRVCEDLADRAVAWVERLVGELEGIRYEVLIDRSLWPEGLVQVDAEGAALQAESDAAGCDEALIRGAVVAAAAQMDGQSATARLLLDLLSPQG